jgi:dimethylamine/trimethylamine dehydrogenase
MTHLRCTQNPTIGDEWRRGWHPERIPPRASEDRVLVVGAGPAGLECARALGQRGYRVALAERGTVLGGRVAREAALPGLGEWRRVSDWRQTQIRKMANVEVFLGSDLSAESVLELGFPHVVLATGARWRADGVGRAHIRPVPVERSAVVTTPDEIMAGLLPPGPVLVYDDDHYYMGSVIAERLAQAGLAVTLVTPAAEIAAFTAATLELRRIARRLAERDIRMITHHRLERIGTGIARLGHVHTDRPQEVGAAAVVMVTARLPEDRLHTDLAAAPERLAAAGIRSLARIGDCLAPGAIYLAVYAGHRFAREFDGRAGEFVVRRERIALGSS